MLLNALVRRRLPIHIVSTHTQRQGIFFVTYMETDRWLMIPRIEIVCWIAESKHPFAIVKDRGFRELIKTGHPEYWLPSPATVSRDVKHVFVSMRSLVASKLKVSLLTYSRIADTNTKMRRHSMVAWTLLPTHRPPPMDKHTSLWPYTLRSMGSLSWCYLT